MLSLAVREEKRLRVLEDRVLKRIFGDRRVKLWEGREYP
jgi:hypothetical protein